MTCTSVIGYNRRHTSRCSDISSYCWFVILDMLFWIRTQLFTRSTHLNHLVSTACGGRVSPRLCVLLHRQKCGIKNHSQTTALLLATLWWTRSKCVPRVVMTGTSTAICPKQTHDQAASRHKWCNRTTAAKWVYPTLSTTPHLHSPELYSRVGTFLFS